MAASRAAGMFGEAGLREAGVARERGTRRAKRQAGAPGLMLG
jgi:hypothetical protein